LCCCNKGYKRPRRKQLKLIAFAGIADGFVQAFFGSHLFVWERSSLPARYCSTNDPTPAPLLLHLTSLKGVAMALSVVGKLVSKAFS
jgi:hypothetical protein